MSYRPQIPVMVRSAARYVDRIIKGEKTGDLPLTADEQVEAVAELTQSALDSLGLKPGMIKPL